MSDFRGHLRAELVAAAERRLARSERWWRHRAGARGGAGAEAAGLGRLAGTLARGALVLCTLALAGALIVVLGQRAARERVTVPEHRDPAASLTPCSMFSSRSGAPQPGAPQSGAQVPRVARVLGVVRRPSRAADRGAGARCAARTAVVGAPGSATVYADAIRAVGRGLLGGEMFLVPVSHLGLLPDQHIAGSSRRSSSEPAVCIVTVGYVGTMSGAGGCTSLASVVHAPQRTLSAAEIPTFPSEQSALRRAGVPATLRSGSIVAGVFGDRVARIRVQYPGDRPRTLPVRTNVVAFHTPHSAPVAARALVTLLDAQGRAIQP
jgi:hypothetical protein